MGIDDQLTPKEAVFDPDFASGGGGGGSGSGNSGGASGAHDVLKTVSRHQLVYSLAGLTVGLVCTIGGIVLFLFGVVGESSWTATILGAESELSDAAPGALLFVVGLFIVLVTRYTFKVKK